MLQCPPHIDEQYHRHEYDRQHHDQDQNDVGVDGFLWWNGAAALIADVSRSAVAVRQAFGRPFLAHAIETFLLSGAFRIEAAYIYHLGYRRAAPSRARISLPA